MRTLLSLLALALPALAMADCGSSGTCTGQCQKVTDTGNLRSIKLLWSGDPGATPPACPETTPFARDGSIDAPPTTVECDPPCACTTTQGFCSPPTSMGAQSADCFDFDPPPDVFLSPPAWDGSCAPVNPGAGAKSVLAGEPVVLSQAACQPGSAKAVKIEGVETAARVCNGSDRLAAGLCDGPQICAYPKAPGFSVCLAGDGDQPCPLDWPNKHLFFDEALECNCSCLGPTGESCSATVTLYGDDTCTDSLGSASTISGTADPGCIQLAPGDTVKSSTATDLVYHPGICAPNLVKNLPSTLCCLP